MLNSSSHLAALVRLWRTRLLSLEEFGDPDKRGRDAEIFIKLSFSASGGSLSLENFAVRPR